MVNSSNALAAILLKEFPAFLPLFYKNPNASLTVIWNSKPGIWQRIRKSIADQISVSF
jgi:hypothetical protein